MCDESCANCLKLLVTRPSVAQMMNSGGQLEVSLLGGFFCVEVEIMLTYLHSAIPKIDVDLTVFS